MSFHYNIDEMLQNLTLLYQLAYSETGFITGRFTTEPTDDIK